MGDNISKKKIYRSSINTADGFLDEHIYDEEQYRQAENEKNNREIEKNKYKKNSTKKQKDYVAIKTAFIRIILSGIIFLLIYCIAEFKPSFVPFTINDIKDAISSNMFKFIK